MLGLFWVPLHVALGLISVANTSGTKTMQLIIS